MTDTLCECAETVLTRETGKTYSFCFDEEC